MAGLPVRVYYDLWTERQREEFACAMTREELRATHLRAKEYFCAALGYAPEPKPVRKAIPLGTKCLVAHRHGGRWRHVVAVQCPRCDATGEIRWLGQAPLFVGMHIDHILPVSLGGTNHPDNLRLLCPRCNIGRGNREVH